MNQPEFDLKRAHGWFATELNNNLWDRLEAGALPADEAEALIHAAHASAYHWAQIGTAANLLRAECLVANVYAALGLGAPALRHSRRCLDLIEQNPDAVEDWDLAFAYDALARAHAAAGDGVAAAEARQEARRLGDGIGEADDRTFFQRWFATGELS